MGIDDRDYMRGRYRERRGLWGTRWNDRKSRVEQDGAWFAAKTVSAPVRIDPHWTDIIALHRSRWGNLRASADFRSPSPLN